VGAVRNPAGIPDRDSRHPTVPVAVCFAPRSWSLDGTTLALVVVAKQFARIRTGENDMRLSDENLRGRTVIAADGQAMGEVSALFLDAASWRVESLLIKLHKDIADRIGASRSMLHAGTVEIPTQMIQSVGDAVVLNVPVDELRAAVSPVESAPAVPVH
jgi:sporulation protein YlmC with PRC-barrel domain